MPKVIKAFADSTDHFKRYEIGDDYKGDAKRIKFLTDNGYLAKPKTEKKEAKPKRAKKEK